MGGTPFSVSPFDPFVRTGSSPVVNAADHGVSQFSPDNAPALQALINSIDAQGAHIVLPIPSRDQYEFRSPIFHTGDRIVVEGSGFLGPALNFDLSAYVGPLPKYPFIIGDPLTDPSVGSGVEGNALRGLRINGVGCTGSILTTRANVTELSRLTITGAGMAYGIRAIAGDSKYDILDCLIGNADSATTPAIGISLENGNNQTLISGNAICGINEAIRLFNVHTTKIEGNRDITCRTSAGSTAYGVRVLTDQPVPAWLTWLPAGVGCGLWICDNLFEPGITSGNTIYDVFIGSGVPSVHSFVGTRISGNIHFGSDPATRVPYVFDYADGVYLEPWQYFGPLANLVWFKSHVTNCRVNAFRLATYNTSGPSTFIRDDTNGAQVFIQDDSAGAGFSTTVGSVVMGKGSPFYMQDASGSSSVLLSNSGDTLRIQSLPIYADNAAAVAAGEQVGNQYKTATGEVRNVV